MLQILLNHLFRHLAYRGTEVPPRPEMPTPVPLSQMQKFLKQLARRPPLDPTNPEVVERTSRRRFTAKYKLRVLEQANGCAETGQIVALMRREELYPSDFTTWRRQREAGALAGLAPRNRGHKANPKNRQAQHMAELERERTMLIQRNLPAGRLKKGSPQPIQGKPASLLSEAGVVTQAARRNFAQV